MLLVDTFFLNFRQTLARQFFSTPTLFSFTCSSMSRPILGYFARVRETFFETFLLKICLVAICLFISLRFPLYDGPLFPS